ncbi:MAG: hypothetical protein ACK4K0_09450 [Flavobacteriales bacterium]
MFGLFGFGQSSLKWGKIENADVNTNAQMKHILQIYNFTRFIFTICGILFFIENAVAQRWMPIDSGVSGHVNALTTFKEDLYAAGNFIMPKSQSQEMCFNISRWDGLRWRAVGNDTIKGEIYSLVEYKDELYAGGKFSFNGDNRIYNMAIWNGAVWRPILAETEEKLTILTVYQNNLYACAENKNHSYISKRNGGKWSKISEEIQGRITALTVFNGNLYCVGNFSDSAVITDKNIVSNKQRYTFRQHDHFYLAKYNGENWLRIDTSSYFKGSKLDNVVSVSIFKGDMIARLFFVLREKYFALTILKEA